MYHGYCWSSDWLRCCLGGPYAQAARSQAAAVEAELNSKREQLQLLEDMVKVGPADWHVSSSCIVATWSATQLATLLHREVLSHGDYAEHHAQHRSGGRILSGKEPWYTSVQVSSTQLEELEAHIAAATAASAAAGPTGEGAHGSASEQPLPAGRTSARVKRRVKRHVLVRCAQRGRCMPISHGWCFKTVKDAGRLLLLYTQYAHVLLQYDVAYTVPRPCCRRTRSCSDLAAATGVPAAATPDGQPAGESAAIGGTLVVPEVVTVADGVKEAGSSDGAPGAGATRGAADPLSSCPGCVASIAQLAALTRELAALTEDHSKVRKLPAMAGPSPSQHLTNPTGFLSVPSVIPVGRRLRNVLPRRPLRAFLLTQVLVQLEQERHAGMAQQCEVVSLRQQLRAHQAAALTRPPASSPHHTLGAPADGPGAAMPTWRSPGTGGGVKRPLSASMAGMEELLEEAAADLEQVEGHVGTATQRLLGLQAQSLALAKQVAEALRSRAQAEAAAGSELQRAHVGAPHGYPYRS